MNSKTLIEVGEMDDNYLEGAIRFDHDGPLAGNPKYSLRPANRDRSVSLRAHGRYHRAS